MAEFGLRILLYVERAERDKERERQIRLALLMRGADGHALFPEVFGPGDRKEDGVDADVSHDYDRVKWQVPSSEDEWARTVAALANSHVSVPTPADPNAGWV